MFPIIDELLKINEFKKVIMPSNRRLYEMYGMKLMNSASNENEVAQILNPRRLDTYADLDAYDRFMALQEAQQSAAAQSVSSQANEPSEA